MADKKEDAMLTMAFMTLIVVLLKVVLGGVVIGAVNFGGIDSATIAALLTPTLGAYVVRRYTDSKAITDLKAAEQPTVILNQQTQQTPGAGS